MPDTLFHASTTITCAPLLDPEPQQCEAFVIRRGFDGTATVKVRGANGFKRHPVRQGRSRRVGRAGPDDVLGQGLTAWYRKSEATFSDVLAMVRRVLWAAKYFPHSAPLTRNRSPFPPTIGKPC